MKKLSAVGVMSVFKVSLILGAVLGFLGGIIMMIKSFMEKDFTAGLLILVAAPIFYGLIMALGNALMAWLYNLAADRIGGIEISIED